MNGKDVRATAEQCSRFLRNVVDADWSARIPDLDWTVAQAVVHTAKVSLWYAIDLSAAGAENHAIDPIIHDDMKPIELVLAFDTMAVLLGHVVDGSRRVRGYHPFGRAD